MQFIHDLDMVNSNLIIKNEVTSSNFLMFDLLD